jgi:hypothetical protein
MSLAIQATMLMAMVFVCTTLGWLIVALPRRAKSIDHAVAKAPAPMAKAPRAETERKPARKPEAPAPAEKVAPAPTVPPREVPRPRPEPERPAPAAPAPAPERPMLTYERNILPIIQRSCITCHGERKKRGGLDLRTLAAAKRGGESGAAVNPDNPDDSTLLESVVSNKMPPGKAKLTAAEKQLIREWIAGGAKGER